VLAAVAVLLLIVEAAVRLLGGRFSLELQYIQAIDSDSRLMRDANALRVVVLGNSLTRAGFDLPAAQAQMRAEGYPPPHVQVVALSGTNMPMWLRIYERWFEETGRKPDVVILQARGRHLEDDVEVGLGRLGYHCRLKDLAGALCEYCKSFDDQAEFLQSYVFASFANRQRARDLVLRAILPHYVDGMDLVRQRVLAQGKSGGGGEGAEGVGVSASPSFRKFTELASRLQADGVKFILVSMPTRSGSPLDDAVPPILRQHGGYWLDCRKIEGLDMSKYSDGTHLNEDGRGIFSKEFGHRIIPVLQEIASPSSSPPANPPTPPAAR
jgi:hypothetical protein